MKKPFLSTMVFFLFLLFLPQIGQAVQIGFLEIIGNYHVTREEIVATLVKCKEGYSVTLADIDNDIFRLRDLGIFQDVKYRLTKYIGDTMTLTFEVLEYPYVKEVKVRVEGPDLVDTKDLKQAILVEGNQVLNYKKLFRTISAIKTFFMNSGYHTVEVTDNLQKTEGGVYLPDQTLILTIKEYGLYDVILKGELGDITYSEVRELLGVRTFKDYYEDFWRWLRIKSKYYPSVPDYQMGLSKLFSTGLIGQNTKYDFEVLEEPLKNGEHVVNLVLTIELNPVVPRDKEVQTVLFTGNTLLSGERLRTGLRSIYSPKTILMDVLRDAQTIKKTYEEEGFPFVIVTPSYDAQRKAIVFSITEAVVSDIRVEGLVKTQEYLVWKEVRLKKGESIEMKDLKQTYINLNRTGYFESVDIEPLGFSAGATSTVMVIHLVESSNSITVNAGVSYDPRNMGSTFAQKIYGTLSLALANPFGYGQTIDFSATLGKYPTLKFGYEIASIFGSPFDAGVNLAYQDQYTSRRVTDLSTSVTYEEEKYTITPELTFHITDSQRITGSFAWGKFTRKDFSIDEATATTYIKPNGDIWTLSLMYTYDTRDDTSDPMEGINAFIRGDFSLPFATDPWLRFQENFTIFFSPFDYHHTFGGRLLLSEEVWDPNGVLSYTLGGANNFLVRGIPYDRAPTTDHFGVLNLEYRLRLSKQGEMGVAFAAFTDQAFAFNDFSDISLDNWLITLGGGMRFTIPGFGVLRLDIGWDFSPTLWDEGGPQWGGFHFGFGQMF
ncbi:MAG: BamA/TamA family outer membrane protein [Thermotogaceae bacterium]|nr:POTRA domain-containing protein [Thermotogota bacterium]NLZ15019.1 BamA/TamA family outer membrane protein [Thermotogaceae bacterium]MDD8053337.1 POTRA domain-containing protein [Thermotogota bacterium]HOZ11266.1 POTRA domain-containing protein [Thermotogota bacterium]HPH09473.1 POTRA domain-containing protein [Thermotogota bacterium]